MGDYSAAELLREKRKADGRTLHEHRPLWLLPPLPATPPENREEQTP